MRRKVTSLSLGSLVIAIVLLAVIACSQPAPTATPKPSPAPTATQAPTSAPSPTPTATPKPPAKVTTIKASVHIASSSPYAITMERAIKLIEQRSGGQIKFDYYPAASLYDLEKGTKALMDGLVGVSSFKAGYFPEKFGIVADVANLPLNFPDQGFRDHLRDPGGFFEWTEPYYERNGVKILANMAIQAVGIVSKKPIAKLADYKGVLMRCVAGPAADGFKLLGAAPVFIAAGDIYEGLVRGTVDASNTPVTSVYSMKLFEVAKYYSDFSFSTAGSEQGMNLNLFKSLSPELQKIVVDSYKEAEQGVFKEFPAMVAADTKKLTDAKVTIVTIDKAELELWSSKMGPIFDGLAKKYGADWDKFFKIRQVMMQ